MYSIYRWCKIDEWRISRREISWLPLFSRSIPLKFDVRRGQVGKRASGQAWRGRPSSFSYLGYWVVGSSASLSLPHLVDAHSKLRDASATTRRRDTISAYAIRKIRGKLLLRDEQFSREQREITEIHHTIQSAARPWLTMRARNWRFHLACWFLKGSSHDLFKVTSTRWRRKDRSTCVDDLNLQIFQSKEMSLIC